MKKVNTYFSPSIWIVIMVQTLPSYSQPPMPFPQDATWSIKFVIMGEFYPFGSYGIVGDTLINGESYKRIGFSSLALFDASTASHHSALRDESGKWFVIPAGEVSEYLLYDFTGEVGDTVTVQNPFNWTGEIDPVQLIVVSIDTNEYEGPARRTWHLETSFGWDEYWYEGIGSWWGLYHHLALVFDAGHALVCFHENDSLVFQKEGFTNCEWTVSMDRLEVRSQPLFTPNPATRLVQLHPDIRARGIAIYDGSGRLALDVRDQQSFDVGGLHPGMYFVRIMDQEQRIRTAKLMVEH